MRIAIVGCGLIGGSIALAVRERAGDFETVTLDRGDDLSKIAGADLVVLAAPIGENIALLPALRAHLAPETVVTDTGSTKAAIVEAAGGMAFVGGHPIAGAASAGRAEARADLFAGRAWVLTPGPGAEVGHVDRVRRFVEALGATVHLVAPDEHDRLLAFVSHLPQFVVSALMDVVGSRAGAAGLALAGPGLRDTTRLAASPPAIWRDILETNHANIAGSIDDLITVLTQLRDHPTGPQLEATFENAARWRAVLTEST